MIKIQIHLQKYKIEGGRQAQEAADRQTDRQTEVSRRCLPCGASQPSSVRPPLLSWAAHNAPLSPQRAASQLHNTQQLIMESKIPQPQLLVPKYCPLLSTHTLSLALVAQPEATNSQLGQRGHADIQGVTHMKAHAHSHTLNLHEDEHTPPY